MRDLGFKGSVPGAFRIPRDFSLTRRHMASRDAEIIHPNFAFFVPDALSKNDCLLLRNLFAEQCRAPVAVSGYQTTNPNDIGSHRATGWGPELGLELWHKLSSSVMHTLRKHVPGDAFATVTMTDKTPTDWFGVDPASGKPARKEFRRFAPCGISPCLRFMEYAKGGKHNTHYDMCYDYHAHDRTDRRRTLMSVVWYLNENPESAGGATRFIQDNQDHLPIQKRNLDDWTRQARSDEVIAKRIPAEGGALIFWHRMAHDVEEFLGESRIIIRGDLEFAALD